MLDFFVRPASQTKSEGILEVKPEVVEAIKPEEKPEILTKTEIQEVHGGSLVNVSDCLYWFSHGGHLSVPKLIKEKSVKDSKEVIIERFSFDHRPVKASGNCSHSKKILHSHLQLTFDLNNATQDMRKVHMHLRLTYHVKHGDWSVDRWHVLLEPATQLVERNFSIETKHLSAPADFSYSCSSLHLKAKQKPLVWKADQSKKEEKAEEKLLEEEKEEEPFRITVKRFQVQPFHTHEVFASSFDCSTLFTLPQFTGLFSLILFTLGIVIGVSALLRIKSMDRFDSLKSKPLIVPNE
jgi:hypothetical protein